MIIISYSKQTWNEYDDNQTADENLANGGIISADRLNHMETGISNNDTNKVNIADMRKPASDVVGLEEIKDSVLPNGTDFYTLINTSGQPLSYCVPTYAEAQTMVNKPTAGLSAFKLNTASIGDNTSSNYNYTFLTLKDESDGSIYEAFLHTDGSGAITVPRPWYKVADDSTVVHTADMRKPASDVAGIEEVNAKQDKIGYTPADDSKVVHDTDTSNWQKQAMFNLGSYMIMSTVGAKLNFYDLLTQKYTVAGVYYIRDDYNCSVSVVDSVVISEGDGWWYSYGIDSYGDFVYRKINSNSSSSIDTGWVKASNDSKVAHLSGANNFDTVPTYGTNNKPFAINDTGATTARPTGQAVGYQYFDTTLNKPIWYNGSKWVDSTGKTV